jgi:dTDP-glucose 4,6-dehydratase
VDLKNPIETNIALEEADPDLVINFAAESHVDRSLESPLNFIDSNIVGTFNLLESSRKHFMKLDCERKKTFRFYHVSTDEVFGSLGETGKFNEDSPYDPRSPYSASKAASDHLVNAWNKSFNLPTVISNCSNNFGPRQFPEKLIPLTIYNCLMQREILLYGDGENVRDWLYIDDHIDAILSIANKGKIGEKYCIGGFGEISNIKIVNLICNIMDKKFPKNSKHSHLIRFVEDRPGHDKRYSIDSKKICLELGWKPNHNINEGLIKTIDWYINNQNWLKNKFIESGYKGERLGL